ncbi:MAG: 16S rRNA (adenine(1518)-N(6)/adenine(1519)-N(6))-dimethyltransferase RsmA [Clostridia bacterium]|nr:16S rRNA (adenine(1518)-N(6)/adenine(1519)-N(6))-dimethyltransferase RsmA [Clostridia bacterium]
MTDLSNIKTVKNILDKYGFKFSKSLGQNFIVSSTVCPKMAENCGSSDESGILEIGAGIGVLTTELAKKYKKVVSVEIDKNLIPILKETTADYGNIKIINDDILKVDLKDLIQSEFFECDEVCVCANLPYYITSEILMYVLESDADIKSITVMVQKEAAERICAGPGTRNSGAISLAVRFYGTPKILFNVGRGCFIPQPNVDSTVIKIDVDNSLHSRVKNKNNYFKVIKAAYGKRRKNILNSLSMGLSLPKKDIETLLEKLSISAKKRAEELSFDDFVNISNEI